VSTSAGNYFEEVLLNRVNVLTVIGNHLVEIDPSDRSIGKFLQKYRQGIYRQGITKMSLKYSIKYRPIPAETFSRKVSTSADIFCESDRLVSAAADRLLA